MASQTADISAERSPAEDGLQVGPLQQAVVEGDELTLVQRRLVALGPLVRVRRLSQAEVRSGQGLRAGQSTKGKSNRTEEGKEDRKADTTNVTQGTLSHNTIMVLNF